MTLTLNDIRGRGTITVPEAGQVLGVGRDTAYRAAERGEIPTLRLGRTLRVPVPALLELLGERAHTDSVAGASTAPATASNSLPHQEIGHPHGHPAHGAPSSNVVQLKP